MQALGFDTYRYKLAAFVVAGMLAGVAGHMWAMHRGFVNPELIGWHSSAEALLMILLGGLTTLHGPIVGALAYTALGEVAQIVTERKLLVEGLVVLLVVIALPKGLSGIALPRFLRRAPPDRSRQGSRRRGPPRWLSRAPPAARARHPRAHPRLRRAGGRARRLHLAAPGRAACRHRPQRRRQDHAGQHALGRDQAERGPHRADGARGGGRAGLAHDRPRGGALVPAHQHLRHADRARERAPGRAGGRYVPPPSPARRFT